MVKQAEQANEVVAPAPVQQPVQQYQVQQNPNKGKSKWLTFEYAVAVSSLVASALLSVHIFATLFVAWTSQGSSLVYSVGGWVSEILSLSARTAGTGLVTAAIVAVLLAVIALLAFGRVSKAVQDRKGYTKRLSYKLLTYGALAAVAVPAVVLVAKLVSVLVHSLLFIGVTGASSVYKSLYLAEFVPYLIGLAILGAVAFLIAKIINGKNTSRLASFIVLGVTSAALIASIITVTIQAHRGTSRSTTPSTQRAPVIDEDDYLPTPRGGNDATSGIDIEELLRGL